jgi:hypothetical protein
MAAANGSEFPEGKQCLQGCCRMAREPGRRKKGFSRRCRRGEAEHALKPKERPRAASVRILEGNSMRTLLISILSLAVTSIATGPVLSADMIQNYERPHVVKHQPKHVVRARYVERRRLDCTDMTVEYRYIPRTDFVTICHRI